MLRKRLSVLIGCIVGVGLLFSLGPVWFAGTACGATSQSENSELLAEIGALRSDIAALRADIADLQAQLLADSPPETQPAATTTASGVEIQFIDVPRAGSGPTSRGNIAGRVVGLPNPSSYKVVLYAHTDRWYVQPLSASALTTIASDGTWSNWTHLGDRYAALVVRASFQPMARTQTLPNVGGNVLAVRETAPGR